jgi:hypothetical protein
MESPVQKLKPEKMQLFTRSHEGREEKQMDTQNTWITYVVKRRYLTTV